MKKQLIACLLFFLSSLTFAATEAPLQKLTVILDWFPNPDHAPLIVAKEQGFFKEQGLEVELISPADPTDAPKWVAAKKSRHWHHLRTCFYGTSRPRFAAYSHWYVNR